MATKRQITEALDKLGWKVDRWGHYHKELEFKNRQTGEISKHPVRIKIQGISFRMEKKYEGGYLKLNGSYFKHCDISADGEISFPSESSGKINWIR